MLDYRPTLISELEKIGIPVYYELICDSTTETPCITYMESQNSSYLEGDTLGYSNISYYVKLWGNDLSVLAPYAQSISETMRKLGFNRDSFNELWYNQQICMIMLFSATGKEYFE